MTVEDVLVSILDRVQRNSIESSVVATSVDRFKRLAEDLDSSDAIIINIPVITFFETVGTVSIFRIGISRVGIDRVGTVGGYDSIAEEII